MVPCGQGPLEASIHTLFCLLFSSPVVLQHLQWLTVSQPPSWAWGTVKTTGQVSNALWVWVLASYCTGQEALQAGWAPQQLTHWGVCLVAFTSHLSLECPSFAQ